MSMRVAYWIVFALMLLVYGMMLSWTLPAISQGAGGLVAFDLRPTGYSPDAARAFLAGLDDAGRAIYLGPQRMLDLAYPALLGVVIGGALHALIAHPALRRGLILVVLGGALADYYENFLVAGMLTATGDVPDALIHAASRATIVKSALTGMAMIALLIALGRAGLARWRAR